MFLLPKRSHGKFVKTEAVIKKKKNRQELNDVIIHLYLIMPYVISINCNALFFSSQYAIPRFAALIPPYDCHVTSELDLILLSDQLLNDLMPSKL